MPRLLEHAIEIKKNFEKCKLKAYRDAGGKGHLTIGWGHCSDSYFKVTEGMVITQEKADELLAHDIKDAERDVHKDIFVNNLNDYQYSALVDIAFNSGRLLTKQGEGYRPSDLMLALNNNDLRLAAELILKYKCRDITGIVQLGLIRRRKAAWALFNLTDSTQITAREWAKQTYDKIYRVVK